MQTTVNYNRQKELENCNFVKTVLMIMIVIYHSILYWRNGWFIGRPVYESQLLSILSKWLNSFHVYTFTLVSGYIFFYLMFEKERYNNFRAFVKNKSKRLLVPYLFVMSVWVVPFDIYYFEISFFDVIVKYGLGVAPSQLWFLLMLFGVFCVFFIMSKYIKEHTIKSGCIMIILYGMGVIGQSMLYNYFQLWSICCYLIMFWVGFKIRQYGSVILFKLPGVIWIILDIVLFIFVQQLEDCSGFYFKVVRTVGLLILYIVGAIMAFVVLQRVAQIFSTWKKNRLFLFLERYSMPIYLFHQQLIYISISTLNGILHPYIHSFLNFVVALAGSLIVSVILVRFRYTRALLGEK